jgi:hypothetical protein
MLAQRRLANLKLSGNFGLGETKGRSALDEGALSISRRIFGGHFSDTPKAQACLAAATWHLAAHRSCA